MNTLQIANGFLDSKLYENLFNSMLKLNIGLQIYVPVQRESEVRLAADFVYISPCFTQWDRALFYPKQRKIVADIESRFDLSSIDMIHAHTLFSAGYAAYQLHRQHGTPYIVAVRNTDVNVFFKYMLHLRRTGVQVMQNAYRVVFLSPAYRDFVIEKYVPENLRREIREKAVVIPNGIDDYFLQNQPQPRQSYSSPVSLIYVGEINSNKNLELTIQAAERLRRKGREVTLTVVGDILEDKYRKLIDETPFITYFPRCPKESVLEHLRQADIFVMPSHTETFGLVYAEAMSQGLPVLYTKGQGFDGQFPEGTIGYAASDTDVNDLVNKVEKILLDYPQLSENCITNAQRFDWHRIAREYQGIYQAVK